MVVHLMITVNFYMNALVWRKGVSQILLHPMTIVKGLLSDFNKHFHVLFGKYGNMYEGTTNTMELRSVGALALGPSGNTQGGVRCYSLHTGKILSRMMKDIILAKMPEEALDDDDVENTTGVMNGKSNSYNIIVDHVNHPSTLDTADSDGERQTTHFDPIPDDAILQDDDEDNVNDDTDGDHSDDDSSFTGVFPASTDKKFQPNDLKKLDDIESDSDDDGDNTEEYITRYGRTIKPPTNWTNDFP